MMWACWSGSLDLVQWFIEAQGVDILSERTNVCVPVAADVNPCDDALPVRSD